MRGARRWRPRRDKVRPAHAPRSHANPAISRTMRNLRLGACLVGVAFGAGIPAWNLSQPTKLYGISQYDDGAYLGATLRLLAGHLPYRSFDFLQPPGIAVLLLPVAMLAHFSGTRAAIAAARILTAVVAGANAGLAGWIVRHRGLLATAVAAIALGAYPESIEATHTLLLEPYLVFFCLAAVAVAYRHGELASGRRLVLAGVLLGVGTSVKLWGGLVALVMLAGLWNRRDALLRLLAGGLAGGAVMLAPFFVAAPRAFVKEVVLTQLRRAALGPSPAVERFNYLLGLAGLNLRTNLKGAFPVPVLLATVLGLLVLVAVVVPAMRRHGGRFELTVAALAFASSGLVFTSAEFYSHYVYFPAAFDALALGCAAGGLSDGVRALGARLGRRVGSGLRIGFAALSLAALSSVCAAAYVAEPNRVNSLIGGEDPGPAIARYIPAGACVLTDTEIDLIVANRVAEGPGCPTLIDASGEWLVDDPKHPAGSGASPPPVLISDWQQWIDESPYLLFTNLNAFRVPWTLALHEYVDTHFRIVAVVGAIVWVRRAHPIPWADLPPALRRV